MARGDPRADRRALLLRRILGSGAPWHVLAAGAHTDVSKEGGLVQLGALGLEGQPEMSDSMAPARQLMALPSDPFLH